ncbi:MAG: ABC transporter transmembrane domain-containing protein, partial [Candidatus Ornithospirochaeta sp.]
MGKMKFGEKAKNPKATFLRLMKDVFEGRMFLIAVIVLCVILSAWSVTYSASFIGRFIDDVVIPLKGVSSPDFSKAIQYLVKFALVVGVSVAASFTVSWIMVGVAQKSIFDLRIKMFDKLESLPLSYFDQNARGSIMSRFANDTDTLNQLVANGLVQLLTAGMTLVMVFVSMARNSIILLFVVI